MTPDATGGLLVAENGTDKLFLLADMPNRHGLVAATPHGRVPPTGG